MKQRKKRWFNLALLSPSLIGLFVFYIIPSFIVFYYSFLGDTISKEFVGFDNYISVLKNKSFIIALKNSFMIIGIGVPILILISIYLILIFKDFLNKRNLWRSSFLLPMAVPTTGVVLICNLMFSYKGLLNQFMELFHIGLQDWFGSKLGIIIIITLFLWKNLGLSVIFLTVSFNRIPKDYLEIAKLEGASSLQILRKVSLHFLAPTIMFICLFSIGGSFKLFREVYALTGNYPAQSMYLLQHYLNNAFNRLDYSTMATASVVFCIIAFAIISGICIFEHIYGKDYEE